MIIKCVKCKNSFEQKTNERTCGCGFAKNKKVYFIKYRKEHREQILEYHRNFRKRQKQCFCSCHEVISEKYMKELNFLCPKCSYHAANEKHLRRQISQKYLDQHYKSVGNGGVIDHIRQKKTNVQSTTSKMKMGSSLPRPISIYSKEKIF